MSEQTPPDTPPGQDKKPPKTEVTGVKHGKAKPEKAKPVPPEIVVHTSGKPSFPDDASVQHGPKKTVPPIERGPTTPLGGKRLRRYLQD